MAVHDRTRLIGQLEFSSYSIKGIFITMLSLRSLFRYGIIELKSYSKVCFVGLVGMVIQFTVFNILRHFIWPQYANAIATELAIISNFVLNNNYSFKQHKVSYHSHGYQGILKKAFYFNSVSFLSLLIQFIIVTVSLRLFGRGVLAENTYVFIGIIIGSLANYFFYSRFIWKKKSLL